jgi:hypothetical protein
MILIEIYLLRQLLAYDIWNKFPLEKINLSFPVDSTIAKIDWKLFILGAELSYDTL